MNNFLSSFLVISHIKSVVVFIILGVIFYGLRIMQKRGFSFSMRVFLGLIVGLFLGLVLQYFSISEGESSWYKEVETWLGFLADVFLGFIRVLVLPIIGISIIKVLLEISTQVKVGRLLSRAFFWILLSVGIAASIGLFLGQVFGGGFESHISNAREIRNVQNLPVILGNLIPGNIINVMGSNNIIAYVVFCFFIGFGLHAVSRKPEFASQYKIVLSCVQVIYEAVMDITLFVMRFMPYAVVCMIALVLMQNGLSALEAAGSFILLIYVAMVIMFFVHMLFIVVSGLNPITYVKKCFSVWVFAFSSRSSVATLPLTVSCLQERLGVSKTVASFTASIGTTVGLNGCAGYFPTLAVIFVAHSIGVDVNFSFIFTAILVAMLGSLGIAGVPGSATMAVSIMLTGMGFSEYFVLLGIILAIDPIIDMARTFSNVSGAMTASVCTDKSLGTLDLQTYNDSRRVQKLEVA